VTTLNVMNYLTVFALIAVAISVYRQEKYIQEMDKLMYGNTSHFRNKERMLESTKKRQSYIKALYVQCVAYIFANLICYLTYFAHYKDRTDPSSAWRLQIYHVSVRPLQGLFNLVIFVGHKAYDIKVIDRSLTVREAIAKVFSDKKRGKF
jgi:hypothetical protein